MLAGDGRWFLQVEGMFSVVGAFQAGKHHDEESYVDADRGTVFVFRSLSLTFEKELLASILVCVFLGRL